MHVVKERSSLDVSLAYALGGSGHPEDIQDALTGDNWRQPEEIIQAVFEGSIAACQNGNSDNLCTMLQIFEHRFNDGGGISSIGNGIAYHLIQLLDKDPALMNSIQDIGRREYTGRTGTHVAKPVCDIILTRAAELYCQDVSPEDREKYGRVIDLALNAGANPNYSSRASIKSAGMAEKSDLVKKLAAHEGDLQDAASELRFERPVVYQPGFFSRVMFNEKARILVDYKKGATFLDSMDEVRKAESAEKFFNLGYQGGHEAVKAAAIRLDRGGICTKWPSRRTEEDETGDLAKQLTLGALKAMEEGRSENIRTMLDGFFGPIRAVEGDPERRSEHRFFGAVMMPCYEVVGNSKDPAACLKNMTGNDYMAGTFAHVLNQYVLWRHESPFIPHDKEECEMQARALQAAEANKQSGYMRDRDSEQLLWRLESRGHGKKDPGAAPAAL